MNFHSSQKITPVINETLIAGVNIRQEPDKFYFSKTNRNGSFVCHFTRTSLGE